MENINVLSQEEVFKNGIEFDGERICYSGEYGDQVYNLPMEQGGEPVTGLVYEKYDNSHINYYCYYENGIENGEYVSFYESGKIRRFCMMKNGTVLGRNTVWFESGKIKLIEDCKYGITLYSEKWDEDGNLIKKMTEPSDSHKKILAKYEEIYG